MGRVWRMIHVDRESNRLLGLTLVNTCQTAVINCWARKEDKGSKNRKGTQRIASHTLTEPKAVDPDAEADVEEDAGQREPEDPVPVLLLLLLFFFVVAMDGICIGVCMYVYARRWLGSIDSINQSESPPPSSNPVRTLTDMEKLVALLFPATSVARRASVAVSTAAVVVATLVSSYCPCSWRAPSAAPVSAGAGPEATGRVGGAVAVIRCT